MEIVADMGRQTQETFFRYVFKEHTGLICLCRLSRTTKAFQEQFFVYDGEALNDIIEWCQRWGHEQDIYVAPFFLAKQKRTKEYIDGCPCVWADLDECHPTKLLVPPTFVMETSPNRYQALWIFDELQDPTTAEELSRRIAYYHAEDGADKSGWDLTQLLRIPGSANFKYRENFGHPIVRVAAVDTRTQDVEVLRNAYPQVRGYEYSDIPLPDDLPEDPEAILEAHKNRLMPTVYRLIQIEPGPSDDWSKDLWQLENLLYEAGLTREEAYVVCESAACNKYKRDKRPTQLLWKEVCKAFAKRDSEYSLLRQPEEDDVPILSDQELKDALGVHTIIEDYVDWAKSVGDAAWQYHQASAFVTLSSLLAGYVRLPTSFGTVIPNLWFMILADTTLTRKTTAMDLGMDILTEIDPDALLATDGSIEGLYQALALRPGRPSVFLRDEFSGLLEAMTKKEYMAGMAESLTKLYDGKFQKRILRKETIEVKSPVLILFAGGIRTRILQLLNYEHVASGFLPRFIFITAESDISKLRPLGPPTTQSLGDRSRIVNRFASIAGHYASSGGGLSVGGKTALASKAEWNAELTPDAWSRYNKIESDLLALGLASRQKELLTPTFDRLAKSGLKAATLIAASRRLGDNVVVTEEDLIKAFSYIEYWRGFTIEILENIGKSVGETLLERMLKYIAKHPGCSRGEVMQQFHLTARDATLHLDTLDQRGTILRQKAGRGERLWANN